MQVTDVYKTVVLQMGSYCCHIIEEYRIISSCLLQGIVKFDKRGDRETTIEILQQQGMFIFILHFIIYPWENQRN